MEIIKQIELQDTYAIRQEAMYQGLDTSLIKIESDKEGLHYGLFYENNLVSVISLFYTDDSVQFRKFATLPLYQNKGFGTRLLKFILALVKSQDQKKIWCNARKSKQEFYSKLGFKTTDIEFIKNQIAYIQMNLELE